MMSSKKRVDWLRKKKIYRSIGTNVTIMDRKIPLYANLIAIHNNVRIASNVTFITHDIIHFLLNNVPELEGKQYMENVGCIELMDNVFVGANSTILSGVRIGPNAIVAAGAVVTEDVPPNSVVGGVPAKMICSMEKFLNKRKLEYPAELAPKGQKVSDELADFLWNRFDCERE